MSGRRRSARRPSPPSSPSSSSSAASSSSPPCSPIELHPHLHSPNLINSTGSIGADVGEHNANNHTQQQQQQQRPQRTAASKPKPISSSSSSTVASVIANTSNTSAIAGPRLVCFKQTSPAEERVGKDDKKVHVVVKNAPFVMQLGVMNNAMYNQVVNLHHLTFDASLIYDTSSSSNPNLEKKVDFVRVKPLEYKTRIHENGTQVNLEVRLKVLTSQHEDMFFRVKVQALDPTTGALFAPGMMVISDPVKV
jgi:hypothetical protein